MAGIKNSTLCAKNADYTQSDGPNANSSENNGLVTNGKLWIGSTALNVGGTHINVGSITSPSSTVTIGYSTPNITIDVSGSTVGQTITGNTGGALSPVAGNWNIFGAAPAAGTTPVATAGSGNTLTINVQRSQAIAAANVNNIGLAAFDSAKFTVTATGFVSASGTGIGQTITGNSGGALSPTGGNWNILGASAAAGTSPVTTSGAGSTLTVNVQTSQAIASTDATKIGLANFNSSQFSVDANGFVSSISGGLVWVDATSSTQALLAQHGYVTDRGAGVTYTLPASGTLGDTIKIVGKLGIAVITPNANQQILIGSVSGTVGVTGTATANNVGDCLELICITAGASTVWRADAVVGTWTLA